MADIYNKAFEKLKEFSDDTNSINAEILSKSI
jgi:hypothetical protein